MKKITGKSKRGAKRSRTRRTIDASPGEKNRPQRSAQLAPENRQLRAQVRSLTQELDRCRAELTATEFSAVMAHGQGASDELFTVVEAQNQSLMNLFVAATRLHSNTERAGVLAAIREILSDLIGSRALAVFEIDASGNTLSLVESIGIDPAPFARIPIGSGVIGKVAGTGEAYFGDGGDSQFIACIPLKIGPRVTGAIVVFRLLEQKLELQSSDHELLDFMSAHAALALHRTAAEAQWNAFHGACA